MNASCELYLRAQKRWALRFTSLERPPSIHPVFPAVNRSCLCRLAISFETNLFLFGAVGPPVDGLGQSDHTAFLWRLLSLAIFTVLYFMHALLSTRVQAHPRSRRAAAWTFGVASVSSIPEASDLRHSSTTRRQNPTPTSSTSPRPACSRLARPPRFLKAPE